MINVNTNVTIEDFQNLLAYTASKEHTKEMPENLANHRAAFRIIDHEPQLVFGIPMQKAAVNSPLNGAAIRLELLRAVCKQHVSKEFMVSVRKHLGITEKGENLSAITKPLSERDIRLVVDCVKSGLAFKDEEVNGKNVSKAINVYDHELEGKFQSDTTGGEWTVVSSMQERREEYNKSIAGHFDSEAVRKATEDAAENITVGCSNEGEDENSAKAVRQGLQTFVTVMREALMKANSEYADNPIYTRWALRSLSKWNTPVQTFLEKLDKLGEKAKARLHATLVAMRRDEAARMFAKGSKHDASLTILNVLLERLMHGKQADVNLLDESERMDLDEAAADFDRDFDEGIEFDREIVRGDLGDIGDILDD